jgi:hypothetical protein
MIKEYVKSEIFKEIDNISIERVNNQIITKYCGIVKSVANVSNIYEIFDIGHYFKKYIDLIEQNFTISQYELIVRGGIQYLKLFSDNVKINDIDFQKAFYILNSTDRSRKLNINAGLYSRSTNLHIVGKSISFAKRHTTGVTEAAEIAIDDLNTETFNDQIKSLSSLIGHRVSYSKLRQVILGDDENIPEVNYRRLDALNYNIRYNLKKLNLDISTEQKHILSIRSKKDFNKDLDFFIDAFSVLSLYLKNYNDKDSHIIKNETERIMKITQWAVRNNVLAELGI